MTRTLALIASLFLIPSTARAHAAPARPGGEDDTARAEKILRRLDELEVLTRSGLTLADRRAQARKLRASLADSISKLRGGVLKTELKTSLFFYEQAAGADGGPARCEDERPGAYRSLCLEVSGDRRELLLAKARLRAEWAAASARLLRGDAGDDATRETLREMAAEREVERALAAEAVAGLRRIGRGVLVYDSLGDFEEGGARLARVPFERFGEELAAVSKDLGRLLAWLPRDDCREEIRKATQSYLDGAWWWSKVQSPQVVNVSNNSFAEPHTAFAARPVNASAARYTVAVHWRQARDYTRRAESLLGAM